MARTHGLTDADVVAAIEGLTARKNFPPTLRELADELGLESKGSMHARLVGMRERGLVAWQPDSPRTLRVIDKGESP